MTLRDVTEDDLPTFFEHQRDPEANRIAVFGPRDRATFFAHWRTNVLGNPANLKKTIVVDGAVAGNVVSWTREGRRLVGYWLGREFWGRGIATAALRELVTAHEPTRPLYAEVATQNVGSVRVLEKCGFLPTGEVEIGADGVEERVMRLR